MEKLKKRKYKISFVMNVESETAKKGKDEIIKLLESAMIKIKPEDITTIHGKRTLQQNKAIHLWLTQLSKALRENGITMQMVLKPGTEIWSTPYLLKELVFKPVMKALFGKKSTTELKSVGEIEDIIDVIDKAIGERGGVSVPFPCEELRQFELENGKINHKIKVDK